MHGVHMARLSGPTVLIGAAIALSGMSGCRAIPPKLADAVPGLTLETVQQVQTDPTLTPTDRLAIIRKFLGVEDDEAGNRLATFILNLQVPPEP